jgi:hypothetical protein
VALDQSIIGERAEDEKRAISTRMSRSGVEQGPGRWKNLGTALALILLPVAISVATWLVFWRQLARLGAVREFLGGPPASRPVRLVAVVPDEDTVLLAFARDTASNDDSETSTELTMVVERPDIEGCVAQLERWCALAAPLLMRSDPYDAGVTVRSTSSRVSIDLRPTAQQR